MIPCTSVCTGHVMSRALKEHENGSVQSAEDRLAGKANVKL
jgi:hypothetical protein